MAARKTNCPHCGLNPSDPPAEPPTWPDDMDLTQVHGTKGQMAWRQAIVKNRIKGSISVDDAKAYSQLIDGAARAKTPTGSDGKGKAESRLAAIQAQLMGETRPEDDDEEPTQ